MFKLWGIIPLLAIAGLALVSCDDNPSEPARDNEFDQYNSETSGDPFELIATVGDIAVTLNWAAVSSESLDRYLVKRRVGSSGPFDAIATIDDSVTTYDDINVDVGQTLEYKIAVLSVDGTESDISSQVAVVVHTLASFSINNGDIRTASRSVTLFVNAADCDSLWIWNGTPDDSTGGQWFTKGTREATFPWVLDTGEDRKTVRACLHYTSQQGREVSDFIEPALFDGAISIANDADYSSSQTVTLNLTDPAAVQMKLANREADLLDAPWQMFTTSVEIWELLAGDGAKSVYVQYQNDFLVGSQVYSDAIILDQTPPDFSEIIPFPVDNACGVAHAGIPLDWTEASDAVSGMALYRILFDTEYPPETEIYLDTTSSFTLGLLPFETDHYWQVVAIDNAGNESASDIWTFTTAAESFDGFILISAGTYTMGSPADEPTRSICEEQHDVTLSEGFLMSPYEVTKQLWSDVMGGSAGYNPTLPQIQVSWNSAVQFCNALSELRGLTPAYTYSGEGHASWNPDANGYRLPTEGEWEYGCRAGSLTAFANGDMTVWGWVYDPVLVLIGWYQSDGAGPHRPSRVGELIPNSWGLYDLHGNAAEWCWDVYQCDLGSGPVTDPIEGGYSQNTLLDRVDRGGSYERQNHQCRSASRSHHAPNFEDDVGIRLVRSIE